MRLKRRTLMDTEERRRFNLGITAGTANIWKRAALELGFVVVNGPHQHEGNVSQLLSAVAAGKIGPRKLEKALEVAREAGEAAEAMQVDITFTS